MFVSINNGTRRRPPQAGCLEDSIRSRFGRNEIPLFPGPLSASSPRLTADRRGRRTDGSVSGAVCPRPPPVRNASATTMAYTWDSRVAFVVRYLYGEEQLHAWIPITDTSEHSCIVVVTAYIPTY
ncbi:hypothetical protein EVAR_80637_1 [Eumeta japonica]|uniref:Uncharacterized protein n=1 Tax=Eumeta variegata TaxID=151549 RepID=A0A4C1YW64_EUMVA|nr:hypothetical protein EVAR_80637_1 [Eumeta japonica]